MTSSRAKQRQQKNPQGSIQYSKTVNTSEGKDGRSFVPAQDKAESNDTDKLELFEQILERGNLFRALDRVKKNKGAPGIDQIAIDQLPDFLKENWLAIKERLLSGTYQPLPVKQVEIPKATGGVRKLGIPTVVDRLIQQAISQILTPIFDPTFSDHSYGFRPGRSAQQAVKQAKEYLIQGYSIVVDTDLENFFNSVNHDILMSKIARRIQDKRVLRLIRAYLNAGIMIEGAVVLNSEGTPQGSPLSPLLSNIMLDELDKELERRGHKFCRYADDQNVYVKTERAGLRVLESIKKFLWDELKLKINVEKSAVAPAWKRKFLGYSFLGNKTPRIRVAKQSIERFKNRIREITRGHRSQPVEERIQQIVIFTRGWIQYFRLIETARALEDLDSWVRRRLRMCLFKQWRKPRTRLRELRRLGLKEEQFGPFRSGKKYWHLADISYAKFALNNQYWGDKGYIALSELWRKCHTVS